MGLGKGYVCVFFSFFSCSSPPPPPLFFWVSFFWGGGVGGDGLTFSVSYIGPLFIWRVSAV